jgi:hypothetical protein
MILGSVLVMSGLAGWFLAGLVSAVGSALIGFWLLRINRAGQFTRDLRTLGFLAGLVMLVGLLGLLGVLRGLDDWQAAPWFVICSQLSWLGTYGLYPIWCVGLARRLGRAGSGRLTPSRSGSGETRT